MPSRAFGAELVTDDATAVDLVGDVKTVTDSMGNTHHAKTVILANGSGYRISAADERLFRRGVCGAQPATDSSSATRTLPW